MQRACVRGDRRRSPAPQGGAGMRSRFAAALSDPLVIRGPGPCGLATWDAESQSQDLLAFL